MNARMIETLYWLGILTIAGALYQAPYGGQVSAMVIGVGLLVRAAIAAARKLDG
jgi:hypothetical protein